MWGSDSCLLSWPSSLTVPYHETGEVLVKCLKAGPFEVGREEAPSCNIYYFMAQILPQLQMDGSHQELLTGVAWKGHV